MESSVSGLSSVHSCLANLEASLHCVAWRQGRPCQAPLNRRLVLKTNSGKWMLEVLPLVAVFLPHLVERKPLKRL